MKCPTCETGKLVDAVRDVPYVYKGKKTVIKAVKGRFCDNPKCPRYAKSTWVYSRGNVCEICTRRPS